MQEASHQWSKSLSSPDSQARRAAVWGLLEESGPDAAWPLVDQHVHDVHQQVRDAVTEVLASRTFGEELRKDVLQLIASVDTENRSTKLAAITALASVYRRGSREKDVLEWKEVSTQALELALGDDDDLRYQSLLALTVVAADKAALAKATRRALESTDPELVAVACRLISRHDLAIKEEVEAALSRAGAEEQGRMLVLILERHKGNADAVPDGLWALVEKEVRKLPHGLEVCRALGQVGGSRADTTLKEVLSGWFVHRLLKVSAAAALATKEPEHLLGFLSHKKEDARGYAIECVGNRELIAFQDRLIAILQDSADYHADTAAFALGQLGTIDAKAALQDAAQNHATLEVREEAEKALGALNSPQNG